ncbi:MAG: DHHW family protein [bacterium]
MKKVFILIIILVVITTGLFFTVEKKEFSESENRILSTFPEFSVKSLFSGDYISSIDEYINDHFPFRTTFLKMKTNFEYMLNVRYMNEIYIGEEYLFLEYTNTTENVIASVDKLNQFYLNNNDVDMNLILVGSSSYINSDLLPNFVSVENEDNHYNYAKENILFNFVDTKDLLGSESYYKLDHHYNLEGAKTVYEKFTGNKISTNIALASSEFYGTLSSKSSFYLYEADKMYYYKPLYDLTVYNQSLASTSDSLYEESFLEEKDKYSFFLGGNHALLDIDVKNNKNKEVLIIKDSYANIFIPFLTNDYSKIHVIDLRFYNMSVSDYVKTNEIDEVIFFYNTNSFNNDSKINLLR